MRCFALTIGLMCACCLPAKAEQLVTDLSDRVIEITSRFSGRELLLFGAIDRHIPQEDGGHGVVVQGLDYDIIVVVKSDPVALTVRRKENVGGIWINKSSQIFENVPGYYAIASTRPLEDILPEYSRRILGLGLDNVSLEISAKLTEEEQSAYQGGLLRNMVRKGLYSQSSGSVSLQEDILFRAGLDFPANVPVGNYWAKVFLVRDREVISSSKAIELLVDKRGIERLIYNFAHQSPALYGIMAVLMALFVGWLGGLLSRKVS